MTTDQADRPAARPAPPATHCAVCRRDILSADTTAQTDNGPAHAGCVPPADRPAASATSSGSASDWIDDMATEREAIREDNREAAAVEAGYEAWADGASDDEAREVYRQTLARDDERIDAAPTPAADQDDRWRQRALLDALAHGTREMQAALLDIVTGDTSPERLAQRLGAVRRAVELAGRVAGIAPAATATTVSGDGSETDRAEQWRATAERLQRRVDELEAEARAERKATPEPESSLVDVDPDSPAGRVAAQLAELLTGHLGRTERDAFFSLSRRTGDLVAVPPPLDDPIGHLRAVAGLLPDGQVTARVDNGWLYVRVNVTRDGVTARVADAINPRNDATQAEARAWLAEIGVEVDGATA